MAAEGSRPYLGSPRLAERHVPQASEPQTTEVGSRTPDLPLNQDACVPVPRAQAIALQVDMAMALERVDFAEQYGQSYLCLLQTVFIAGRHPAARAPRWPRLLTGLILSQPAASSGRPADTHTLFPFAPSARTPHPGPHCGGAPSSLVPPAAAALQGAPLPPPLGLQAHGEKVRAAG